MRRLGFLVAAVAAGLAGGGVPEATACGWLWACADRPLAYRGAAYASSTPTRTHRYRGGRFFGYGYRPSRPLPARRWYLATALPATRTDTVGLSPPITTAQGLLHSALPARGPTLFGPNAGTAAWGYAYGNYYGAPAYGYYGVPSRIVPPRDTPSWWIEPRRRR